MSELSLRTVRPTESKEVASLSARFITGFVIAVSGLLPIAAVIVYLEH